MTERPSRLPRRFLAALADLLFPPRCQVCGRFCPTPLCQDCANNLARIVRPWCERCGAPFDPTARAREWCADCAQSRRPALDRARSFGLHCGQLRQAVNRFKFEGRIRLAGPLAALLAALVSSESGDGLIDSAQVDAIIPVPLHPARRRWRGYDQAELLAVALNEATRMPVRLGWLRRVRNTAPQVGQSREAREKNIRGAFAAKEPWPAPGARLLLVDDVYTTGATVRECARVLRRAGAKAVYAVSVSRPVPDWYPDANLIRDV